MTLHELISTPVPTGCVALHWFGQASFALKDDRGTILQIDPYFPLHRPTAEFLHPESPLDESTLPSAAVLVTHDHRDHNCVESQQRFLQGNRGTRYFGTAEACQRMIAGRIPAPLVRRITAGDSFSVGTMMVHAVLAKPPDGCREHGIAPPDVEHLGFVVEASGLRLYFSGDPIRCFSEIPGLVDAVRAFTPQIAILTTHPDEGEFPLFDESAQMARRLGVSVAVPAHYGCFSRRTYDASLWAKEFSHPGDPTTIVPNYNSTVLLAPTDV